MKILLADDHQIIRDLFEAYIKAYEKDAEIVLAESFDSALAAAETLQNLDLIVLDYQMPGMNGVEGLKRMRERHPDIPVAMLSADNGAEAIESFIALGAAGFLDKSTMRGQGLVAAMKLMVSGTRFFPVERRIGQTAAPSTAPADAKAPPPTPSRTSITEREQEVLVLVERGRTNREIAEQLGIAEVTVKMHVQSLLRTLNARNRTELGSAARSLLG